MSVSLLLFLHIVVSDKLGTPEPRNVKVLTISKADFPKHPCCNSWVKPISEKEAQLLLAILHLTISHPGSFGWSSCYSKWCSVKLIGWLVWFKRVTPMSPALQVIFREVAWLSSDSLQDSSAISWIWGDYLGCKPVYKGGGCFSCWLLLSCGGL